MAFGKKALAQLPTRILRELEQNRIDKVVHQTEVRMLLVPSRDTPRGEDMYFSAIEDTMTSSTARTCPHCKETKEDVGLSLTGTCSTCWAKAREPAP